MPNRPYNVEEYETALKAILIESTIFAALFLVLFVALITMAIHSYRGQKKPKKWSLVINLMIVVFAFALIGSSLGSKILSCHKDINEQAYIQYEGIATFEEDTSIASRARRPYSIFFEQNGVQVELYASNIRESINNIEEVYIVYSKHAGAIIEIEFLD